MLQTQHIIVVLLSEQETIKKFVRFGIERTGDDLINWYGRSNS